MTDSKKYTSSKIAHLILLSLCGKAGKRQMDELQEWLKEHEANQRFYQKILSPSYLEQGLQEYRQYDSYEAYQQIKLKIKTQKKKLFKRFLFYAAITVVLMGIVTLMRPRTSPEPTSRQITATPPISPGSSKAQLILPDGQEIELEGEINRVCRQIEGEHFLNDGQSIDYRHNRLPSAGPRMHILRVPRGGEYQLVLSDGTWIWMNAESELVYPDYFAGNQREVELKGEAYFEVVSDTTRPFYITIGDMKVKVFGTSFNISAYPGERRRTTLANGSVAIQWHHQQVVLHPGQQASESPEGLQVKTVNVLNYTGWKARRFIYRDQNLEEVLKELERWYDVEIILADKTIGNLHLTANLPKYENIDKVLDIIKYAVCIEFEIKDRKVIIRQN